VIDGKMISLDINTKAQSSQAIDSDTNSNVTQISWSRDNTKLYTGGELGAVFVWDTQLGKQSRTYKENGTAVDSIAVSPDNSYIAVGFRDGLIRIWETDSGKQIQLLQHIPGGSTDTVLDLEWSSDSKNLISMSRYKPISIWDVRTGKEIRSIDEHTGWINDISWSPSGDRLASGSEDGSITIWEIPNGKRLHTLQDAGWVNCLTWSPNGKYIADGADSFMMTSNITIWNARTGKKLKTWTVNTLTIGGLTWSPDGKMLAALLHDGTGVIWDASNGKKVLTLPANRFSEDIAWSPDGGLLGTSYPLNVLGKEQVTLWNTQTSDPVLTVPGLYGLAWSPDGKTIASVLNNETEYRTDDTTLVLWDPQTGNELKRFDIGVMLGKIGWSPDGKLLVVSENVLDVQTGKSLHKLEGHYDTPTKFVWSPRGDLIASASLDGIVIIWGVETH
jgi:WD40 repeat protein